MIVLLLAHNEIKTQTPPDSEPYDKYQIKLHKSAAALIKEWADAVLFVNFMVTVEKDKKRAVGQGVPIIHTTPSPAWDVKHRFPHLPATLPMEWTTILAAMKNKPEETKEG